MASKAIYIQKIKKTQAGDFGLFKWKVHTKSWEILSGIHLNLFLRGFVFFTIQKITTLQGSHMLEKHKDLIMFCIIGW